MHQLWQLIFSGKWYLTHARPLKKARKHAKYLCWQIQQFPLTSPERNEMLRQLCPHVNSFDIGVGFYCDYGFNIYCEDKLQIGKNGVFLDAGKIHVGRDVTMGDQVVCSALTHHLERIKRNQGMQRSESIWIGNDVVIGNRVTVLSGAIIPDNMIVADDRVITKHCFK